MRFVKNLPRMSLRYTIIISLLASSLLTSPALAESSGQKSDHLAYYTYYKTESGETVSGVAAKFGLAESSLLRMNPQLGQGLSVLPDGSLLCVPKEKEKPVVASRKSKKAAPAKGIQATPSKKTAKKQTPEPDTKASKETEEPNDEEWEIIADSALKGAPEMARRTVTEERPPSRLIRPNGEVVLIPAAKPAPKPKEPEAGPARGKLASRKGKAIHGILNSCRSHLGTPYVWGGQHPGGFDCSGYVQYVFAQHGYKIPRTADIQFEVGTVVPRGKERPGDLVFFETYAPGASHVGVYLGRNYFIHASSSRGVTIDRLSTDFFAQRYLGAKRTAF